MSKIIWPTDDQLRDWWDRVGLKGRYADANNIPPWPVPQMNDIIPDRHGNFTVTRNAIDNAPIVFNRSISPSDLDLLRGMLIRWE